MRTAPRGVRLGSAAESRKEARLIAFDDEKLDVELQGRFVTNCGSQRQKESTWL